MPMVLIVDDNRGIAEAAAILIKSLGCDTAIAHSGEAALTTVRTQPVDLVVLDVAMSGMSGLDVLRQLAAEGIVPRLPVIMFTAWEGTACKALELGAVDFVSKTDPERLIDRVREYAYSPAVGP